jgi:hypothetical protein
MDEPVAAQDHQPTDTTSGDGLETQAARPPHPTVANMAASSGISAIASGGAPALLTAAAGPDARQPKPCATCGAMPATAASPAASASSGYVYAIGQIEPRFPNISVEKEVYQASAQLGAKGTDRAVLIKVLAAREFRYLARHVCWVLSVEGLETYILAPRDPADFALLTESLSPDPSPVDLDVIVGVRGQFAEPNVCGGLMLPVLYFDQIMSYTREGLLNKVADELPVPKGGTKDDVKASAGELLDRILLIADNAGATDEHRALNYLAVRSGDLYTLAARAQAENAALSAINVNVSPLSAGRKVLEVVFSFTDRGTDVTSKSFCRVDVTDEFPFLVTKLSPYFDR